MRLVAMVVIAAIGGCHVHPITQVEDSPPAVSSPTPTSIPSPTPIQVPSASLQTTRWNQAEIRPEFIMRLDKAVGNYTRLATRYAMIESARRNGVPAQIIYCIHGRESDWNFGTNLANGDSLLHRTVNVPRGRIPGIDPPYTFEAAAIDALYGVDSLDQKSWHGLDAALTAIEYYNGPGYRKYHPGVPSPYLWSGTTIYIRGKYGSDGKFDPLLVDRQLGCAAILKQMETRGITLPFPPAIMP